MTESFLQSSFLFFFLLCYFPQIAHSLPSALRMYVLSVMSEVSGKHSDSLPHPLPVTLRPFLFCPL